jgi:hypothetical protein
MVLIEPLNSELKIDSRGALELRFGMSLSAGHPTKRAGVVAARRREKPEGRHAMQAAKMLRAKKLARDPRYPSTQVVESLARLFARHLSSPMEKRL